MKHAIKWLAAVLITPIVLVGVIAVLLYLPPVQNWVVKQVCRYASEQTGMDISIDNVRIAFPLDLELNGFKMIKPVTPPDTVADVRRLVADVQLLPLLGGRVELDALELNQAKVNTTDFIPDVRIKGDIGRLTLQSHGIDLKAERIKIDDALLDNARIDIALSDTVPEDTTESTADWKIDMDKLRLSNTNLTLHMADSVTGVNVVMKDAVAQEARLELKNGIYQVAKLDWNGGSFAYGRGIGDYGRRDDSKRQRGFDADYIDMSDVNIGADSILVAPPRIAANIRTGSFKDKSGLQIEKMQGRFTMDDRKLGVEDAALKTPYSDVKADFNMDLNAFDEENPGKLYADVDGAVGKHDILVFAPDLPKKMMSHWPNRQLTLKGHAEGNMQYVTFKNFKATLPGVVDMNGTGWVANPTDGDRMRADIRLKGHTGDLGMVTAMLPKDVQQQVRIPRNIGIDGHFKINGQQYAADFTATEGGGRLKTRATLDARNMAYNVTASADNLQLQHFLPSMGLSPFSGDITAQGHGTDFLDPKSGAKIHAKVRKFSYGGYDFSGLDGDVSLHNGYMSAKVNSSNGMVGGDFDVSGRLTAGDADLHVKGRVLNADLKRLGVTDQRYVVSSNADVYVKSNLNDRHSIKGHLGDFTLKENRGRNGMATLVTGDFDINAMLASGHMAADFDGRIDRVDFYELGVIEKPFGMSFGADVAVRSNLDDFHEVKGKICNLTAHEREHSFYEGDIDIDLLTRRDTTHVVVSTGDFYLNADADCGYERIMKQTDVLSDLVKQQFKQKRIDQMALRAELPLARLYLEAGPNNIISHLLMQQGFAYRNARIDLSSSTNDGLNGYARVGALRLLADSIMLDSIDLALESDAERLNYDLRVMNNKFNQYPYSAQLKGTLLERGLTAQAVVVDDKNKTGLDLAMLATMEDNGIRMTVTSDDAIIGYKNFHVSSGNYIYIGRDRRVSADMKLQADDGAGAYLYTDDSDETALQNITLSMHRFDLEKVFDVLPLTPQVGGVLDGDFHLIQTENSLTVSSDMTISDFVYEHCNMGNVGVQMVYMPHEDGSHYVDAIITKDDYEVGTLTGYYRSEGKGMLDAKFDMNKFPLHFVNGFIPDRIVGLRGTGEGALTVKGPLNELDINGEVYLDSSYLYSEPYGIEMRFANDPVRIEHSKLLFENFEMFANNDSPLNIQGSLDFSNMERMMLDVRMRARDFLLIDAKENPRSEAYGKAYVNFFGRMQGPLDNLNMRGRLDVLGNTDMTYVLRESPLTSDNQLDELVRFTDFSDTTAVKVVKRPDMAGFTMDMNVNIDEQAHIVCALNAEHTNYIDLIGGGELRMTYNPADDLSLLGRYTLNKGEMKYALPVIPLRTFTIQEGSFLEFTGDPMNPTLNITATERLKSSVSDGTSSGRLVDFECGVRLTETMSKPGIEFIIDAPEDMQMQNELNTKSAEERGKLAVSMLASGMYLGDGNGTTNAAMSGALASFMQSEINNITGSALRSMGLDLSANLETSADVNGALHTDYTFKFSKRLLNNRLRISMGGRVSTGGSDAGQNGAFFDNFSMEYRLNQRETQYLKVFYQRNSYDWLDGNISQFGAGFMWKRKLNKLSEIFSFKSAATPLMLRRDSLVTSRHVGSDTITQRKDSIHANE